MHSKLKSSSPVCIQIGLFTLVELDDVETETASLSVSQKFWRRPNLFTLVELDYADTETATLSVSQKFWRRPNLRKLWAGIKNS
jgi:hypothetical protein